MAPISTAPLGAFWAPSWGHQGALLGHLGGDAPEFRIDDLGDAEVEELRSAIGSDEDVVGLDISMDDEEMADVRWFSREEVLLALSGESEILAVPAPIAIAHHLIKAWASN